MFCKLTEVTILVPNNLKFALVDTFPLRMRNDLVIIRMAKVEDDLVVFEV
jgi:hypothetical protein